MRISEKDLESQIHSAEFLVGFYKTLNISLERIREILHEFNAASERRRNLPAEFVVLYVIALSLWRDAPYREVMRKVLEALRDIYGDAIGDVIPAKSSISKARSRLTPDVFEKLYSECVKVCASESKKGVTYNGLRVMAIDGSTLDLHDCKANAEYYGKPVIPKGEAPFPLLRFVTLAECASHIMIGAGMAPLKVSERELASSVIKNADASMLVLADRGFIGYPMWTLAGEQGCKRLFRIKNNQVFSVVRPLSDGSYISRIYPNSNARIRAKAGKHVEGAQEVRIIEFNVLVNGDKTEKYRLITDLLDEKKAPAAELAALYHRRWRIEVAIGEFKVQLALKKGLRSKTPELVRQEFFAMLIAHGAIRKIISDAADTGDLLPEDLSFKGALQILHRRLPGAAKLSPEGFKSYYASVLKEISKERCAKRRGVRYQRVVKRAQSPYAVQKKDQALSEKVEIEIEIINCTDRANEQKSRHVNLQQD